MPAPLRPPTPPELPLPDHAWVYDHAARDYDALVAREDAAGNLSRALDALLPPRAGLIVELGAGTGRVTRLLAPRADRVVACDAAAAMLDVARERLDAAGLAQGVTFAVASHDALPVAAAAADAVVAGWAIAHAVGWFPADWPERVDRALAEMARVARPGAPLLVIETLGTGSAAPAPPAKLVPFYDRLEAAGFVRSVLRTDYRFADPAEAERLLTFFFGPELAARFAGAADVPECTGLWHRAA